MSTITTTWPPFPIRHQRTQNLEPLINEVLRGPAADSALLEGHITGAERVGNVANPAPLNPSGDLGHDHSGGDYGTPIFHSLGVVCCDNHETYEATGVAGPSITQWAGVELRTQEFAPGFTQGGELTHAFTIWVPPCDVENGAFVDLGLFFILDTGDSNGLASGDEAWVTVQNIHRALEFGGGYFPTTLYEIASPHVSDVKEVESGPASRLRVVPGALNPLRISIRVTLDGSGSNRQAQFWLREFEYGVCEVP